MKKSLLLLTVIFVFSFLNAKSVEDIYFEKCANCHGDKAEESAFGKSKILSQMSESEIVIALIEYKAGTKDDHGLGRIMESQVYALEEDDFKALAKYIKALK